VPASCSVLADWLAVAGQAGWVAQGWLAAWLDEGHACALAWLCVSLVACYLSWLQRS